MHQRLKEKYIDDFYIKCRQAKLSVTPQRLAVYKALLDTDNHPSPEAIFQQIKQDFPMISFATVYKTLETFEQNRIISKVTTLHNKLRFDPLTERHHHMICVKCKKIIDLQSDELDQLSIPSQVTDENTLLDYSVHFNVICSDCRDKG